MRFWQVAVLQQAALAAEQHQAVQAAEAHAAADKDAQVKADRQKLQHRFTKLLGQVCSLRNVCVQHEHRL